MGIAFASAFKGLPRIKLGKGSSRAPLQPQHIFADFRSIWRGGTSLLAITPVGCQKGALPTRVRIRVVPLARQMKLFPRDATLVMRRGLKDDSLRGTAS